jgi:nucleoside 2-deoxyribosyltransferase
MRSSFVSILWSFQANQSPKRESLMRQIYCAGPLFNKAERDEMSEIAAVLEDAGYSTFLPHRDGLELARLLPELRKLGSDASKADETMERAIFSLDVYQLLSCSDGVVANLNGRVPDEGTVVEASLAWHSGKALVLYKADARTILNGSDNPMLVGLGNFRVVNDIHEIPEALSQELRISHEDRISTVLQLGEQIASARKRTQNRAEMAQMLLSHFTPALKS